MSDLDNALHVIVPMIEEVRILRDRLVSQLSAAGVTLAAARTRLPIDDIDEWLDESAAFHQDAIRSGHSLSAAGLTEALQQGPMALATNNPIVSRLVMQMMLGQTYKEKLSEWIADLPGAMQDAERLSASTVESGGDQKGWGLLELIGGAIAGGIGLALLADDKDSSPGLSLLIFGGLAFLKGVGAVISRLLENVGD